MQDVVQWLPDETPQRETYNEFVDQFGTDDFVVVTWPGLRVDNNDGDIFSRALVDADQESLIEQSVSGRQLIAKLNEHHRQSIRSILTRFEGIYFGPDRRTTCVVVVLTARGMDNRGEAMRLIQRVAANSLSLDADQLVLAGHPQIGAYGDEMIRRSMMGYVAPSCVVATIVAWLCLRNITMTLAIFAIGGLASSLSVAVITLSGAKWGALSSVIPTLSYVLTVSGALHLLSYSRSRGSQPAFKYVLRVGWKPCLLSCLTTSAGLMSLCISGFPAIREFGVYSACGVLVSLACQLLFLPCMIDWLSSGYPTAQTRSSSAFLERILPWSSTIVAGFIVVTIIAGLGLPVLRSDLEVERNFSADTSLIKDIRWLEQHIGPVEQSELLVTFEYTDDQSFHNRLNAIRQVESALVSSELVSQTMSVADWIPDQPSGRNLRNTIARSTYRTVVNGSRDELAKTSHLHLRGTTETWRISIRFPFLDSVDFTAMDETIPKLAQDALRDALPLQTFSIEHTGLLLLYNVAQKELVADLYRNFVFAFVMICPLMMLVLRSARQGLVAMIPNVCPAVVVYGLLGWTDYPLDIGMTIAACVALGIAVDDTTHFMLRFQDLNRPSSTPRSEALNTTFRQCSRAMIQTSLITTAGLVAFVVSDFLPMIRFASLLIALVGVALICDIVLLPTLISRFDSDRR